MTIRKGEDWGRPGTLPRDGVVVRSDAEAGEAVTVARRAGREVPPVGLLGGDLWRTLGAPSDPDRLHTGGTAFTVDVGSVLVDGRQHWFVAHLVARRSWWRGPLVAAMNAEWLGRWDVAPRSHPNDGRFEVIVADPSLGDRWKAWRRLPTGSHLPHPDIAVRQEKAWSTDLAPGTKVWLDGRPLGPAHRLVVRVEPDALEVVV